MLKKIKDFFQSIARRIASAWNSIKSLWFGKSQKNSVIKSVRDKFEQSNEEIFQHHKKTSMRKDIIKKLINGKADFSCAIEEDSSKRLVTHIRTEDIAESMNWRLTGINARINLGKRISGNYRFSTFPIISIKIEGVLPDNVDVDEMEIKSILELDSESIITVKDTVASPESKMPESDVSSEAGKPSKLLDNLSKEQLINSKLIISPF